MNENKTLFNDYLNLPSSNGIKLVIMGKDPYPRNPCYIPFCKPNWEDQLSDRYCGVAVLRSVGLNIEFVSTIFNKPIDLFLSLRQQGIVFLNLSYKYVGKKITKVDNILDLIEAHTINEPILNLSDNVILCGEARKLKWVHLFDRDRYHCVVHPDPRNRRNPNRNSKWSMWWNQDAILNKFNLHIDLLNVQSQHQFHL